MTLTEKIAQALYIEGCEAEDGDVVWESPDDIRAEIEGWERFAEAVTAVVRDHFTSDEAVEVSTHAVRDHAVYFTPDPDRLDTLGHSECDCGWRPDYRDAMGVEIQITRHVTRAALTAAMEAGQ